MTETQLLVCIVEDELSLRGALAILLTSAGFLVAAFANAEDFLEFPKRDTVGCILLDIGLPGIDGFELQQRLATDGQVPPLIFMTGRSVEEGSRARAAALGTVAFLQKPFHERELMDAVRRSLA